MTLRTTVLFVLGCGVFWSVTPAAQKAASALPALRDVQAAEAEALTFPHGVTSEEQPNFAAELNLTGTADRKCVEVGDGRMFGRATS